MDLSQEKQALRHLAKARLLESPPTAVESARLVGVLEALPAWSNARLVSIFAALPGEPNMEALWGGRDAREFCLPGHGAGGPEFRVASARGALTLTRRGFFEPPPGPAVDPAEIDLFLVPGLAFDRRGVRLGRGGGYYDRLLARRHPQAIVLGVALARALVADLPREAHDQLMTGLVTERGYREVEGAPE